MKIIKDENGFRVESDTRDHAWFLATILVIALAICLVVSVVGNTRYNYGPREVPTVIHADKELEESLLYNPEDFNWDYVYECFDNRRTDLIDEYLASGPNMITGYLVNRIMPTRIGNTNQYRYTVVIGGTDPEKRLSRSPEGYLDLTKDQYESLTEGEIYSFYYSSAEFKLNSIWFS